MEVVRLDSFEIQCTVTSLRSQKRKRSYLRKIWYLRNFLSLLRIYRAYLHWKYGRRKKKKRLTWRKYDAITWKTFSLRWSRNFMPQKMFTVVLFRFYNCQVTATFLISRMPFQFITIVENLSIDKVLIISLKHETVDWKNNLVALSRCK